jgi:hypothetical protein
MVRVFGRVVGQSGWDATHISFSVEWQAVDEVSGQIGIGNNAVPVPVGLSDTELIAAIRSGLADVVNEQISGQLAALLTAENIMGCQL